jgi:carbamoyl-phosphate synthase small subunit
VRKPALLILADGTAFKGRGFGHPAPSPGALVPGAKADGAGEVVFNTGMSGYHEILTDPSYTGQIVAMTYPLIGNYGASPDWNEGGPEKGVRRKIIKVSGFVVRELYEGLVPPGRLRLEEFLAKEEIPGICEVDTRRLTLRLRDGGSTSGLILGLPEGFSDFTREHIDRAEKFLAAWPSMEGQNLVGEVGTREAAVINPAGAPHFALLDYGIKNGIIRELVRLGVKVTLLPGGAGAEDVLSHKPDAVLLSNGPGDPAVLAPQIDMSASLIGRLPVFGICLGHQIIGCAVGGKTYKLPFGHHGVNNPVVDLRTGKVFVTSQNHGFAVDEVSLPKNVKVWMRNANDDTVEGLYHEKEKLMCVQFHPEACPGPEDTKWIIGEFVRCAGEVGS